MNYEFLIMNYELLVHSLSITYELKLSKLFFTFYLEYYDCQAIFRTRQIEHSQRGHWLLSQKPYKIRGKAKVVKKVNLDFTLQR